MLRLFVAIVAVLTLTGCGDAPGQSSKTKVLIGATLIASPGVPPVEDSIVVVVGDTIRGAGTRKDVPVPQDSERTDLQGKWLAPSGANSVVPGQPANLNVLDHAPSGGNDGPARRMVAGNWVK